MTNPIKCHWCGKFLAPRQGHFHFVPLNEFGPEEAWWECRNVCQRQFHKESA